VPEFRPAYAGDPKVGDRSGLGILGLVIPDPPRVSEARPVFGRRSTSDETATGDGAASSTEPVTGGKGRPTPKRREAEAARKQRLTAPKNRREASRQLRQRRAQERNKMQEALRGGDERYLPARDRGKVRRFVRDLVDSRLNVAEFLLPLLVLNLAVGLSGQIGLQTILWIVTILATTADTLYLWWRIKRELRTRFPEESTKGAVAYGVLRSSQLRRLRLPKPQVTRGQELSDRY
jgi:hypothetical protein